MSLHRRFLSRFRKSNANAAVPRGRNALRRAVSPVIEGLENRQLLAVQTLPGSVIVSGNGFDPATGLPNPVQNYVFEAMDGTLSRVTVGGNAVVHLLFASVLDDDDPNTPDQIVFGAPQPPDPPQNPGDPPGNPTGNIFSIYVEEGSLNSWVAISEISTGNNPQPTPFTGNVALRVAANNGTQSVNSDADSGSLLLGALTLDTQPNTQDDEDRPIPSALLTAPFGDLDPGDTVSPGLRVRNGVNLGRFLFGGTITGQVDIGGSMELFYAGQILTGNADNQLGFGISTANNFRVRGDIRNLIVKGSIGTTAGTAGYNTGFDLEVQGKLGMAYANGNFFGGAHVENMVAGNHLPFTRPLQEVESRITRLSPVQNNNPNILTPTTVSATWVNGFVPHSDFWNDDFDRPQYLGDVNGEIHLEGTLQAVTGNNPAARDYVDVYGVGLMAGQVIEFELDSDLLSASSTTSLLNLNTLQVGIIDPDGRVIASDYTDIDASNFANIRFRFTADRPGVYRVVVATGTDGDFDGQGGFGIVNSGAVPYRLHLWGVGNLGIGGIAAGGNINDTITRGTVDAPDDPDDPTPLPGTPAEAGWQLDRGDFGALRAGNELTSSPTTVLLTVDQKPTATVRVLAGNLRSISANSIGTVGQNAPADATPGSGPELDVPLGSVGEVRSNGILALNPLGTNVPLVTVNGVPDPTFPVNSVGGDYQRIVTPDKFYGYIIANKGLGSLEAGNMFTRSPSVITVNADRVGKDGIIDMIDIRGNFGTLQGGGPAITTGPGGNLRYLNVEGTLFLDAFFGGGQPQNTVYPAGEGDRFRDDSGATIEINPVGSGVLQVLTYGIRGSGGVAVVRAQSSTGIEVESLGRTGKGNAEIGKLLVNGGNADVTLTGKKRLDVLYVVATGGIDGLINETLGEVVSVRSTGNINNIELQNIGVARKSTSSAVLPGDILSNNYPFIAMRTGVFATGNINNIEARGAIGNVSANGTIDNVIANSDGKKTKKAFDGIVGSIFAGGNLNTVNIGQGVLPSGNGMLAHAGIFANGIIDEVIGDQNADIRGNVASQTRINTIRLRGGSIINANIAVYSQLGQVREFSAVALQDGGDSFQNPVYEIGNITVEGGGSGGTSGRGSRGSRGSRARRGRGGGGGNVKIAQGGIIGTRIQAADIGTVRVSRGFGILNAFIGVQGDGRLDTIQTDGYGLRDVQISGGSLLRQLIASGKGNQAKTSAVSASVRQSEKKAFDPFFNSRPNRLTDIHAMLGTSKTKVNNGDATRTGVIAGIDLRGGRNVTLIDAYDLRGSFNVDPLTSTAVLSSTINVANSIQDIRVRRDLADVSVTTGEIDTLRVGRDVGGLFNATIAGTIGELRVGRTFGTNAIVSAVGPDGDIEDLFIGRDLNGSITAEQDILKARVRGAVNGTLADKDGPVTPRK